MAFDENTVKIAYKHVVGHDLPNDNAFGVYWPVAVSKVQNDRFRAGGDEIKTLAACYYIAYLHSATIVSASGKQVASFSKSIGNVSISETNGKETSESVNEWLKRYNDLLAGTDPSRGMGAIVRMPTPSVPFRDGTTSRRILAWWHRR